MIFQLLIWCTVECRTSKELLLNIRAVFIRNFIFFSSPKLELDLPVSRNNAVRINLISVFVFSQCAPEALSTDLWLSISHNTEKRKRKFCSDKCFPRGTGL